jgi:signal transduction histidine kinase
LSFVEDYRRLTKVPNPELEQVVVKDLLEDVMGQMSVELKTKNVEAKIKVQPDFTILLDRNLIEQVIINLVKNAMEAMEGIEIPALLLSSYSTMENNVIEISDNGSGIDPKELNDIWVPFYTTKPSGSGIGLSLTKQVMKLHHGRIKVNSKQGQLTIFTLEFPKNRS